MKFSEIGRPIAVAIRQGNGPLGIVEDADGVFWVVHRYESRVMRPPSESLEEAKEAVAALFDPRWRPPKRGAEATRLFASWAGE